jgi:hypothetical protein
MGGDSVTHDVWGHSNKDTSIPAAYAQVIAKSETWLL